MHFTEQQINSYWRNQLEPTALLAIDEHLEGCAPCRERLLSQAPGPAPLVSAPLADDHLSYEKLVAVLEGRGVEGRALERAAKHHLDQCPACRAELADLERPATMHRRRWHWPMAAAAAILLIGVAARLWLPSTPAPSAVREAAWSLALRDGGQRVGLDPAGALAGFAPMPQTEQNKLLQLLQQGRLTLAKLPADLLTPAGTQLGKDSPGDRFQLAEPLARVMLNPQPRFRWQRLAGATGYRVEIFDQGYRPVIASPIVQASEWTPPKGLERGKLYVWQVTAQRPAGPLTAPQPPAPEARFRIANQAVADALAAVGGSHLRRAQLFAEAGLRQEAQGELELLKADNPGLAWIDRLAASLEGGP